MSDITEIREAIQELPAEQAWQLAVELRDYLDALYDDQFEKDVEDGRLDRVIAGAREERTRESTGGESRHAFVQLEN